MLYKFDGKNLKAVNISSCENAGWKEIDLEEALATQIRDIVREDQLMVISRQQPLQEDADIMALDAKGSLYIFELKRWQGQAEHLLQVLRYGQRFGRYSFEKLQDLFRKHTHNELAHLGESHREHFELAVPLPPQEFNQNQKFIVVAAGTDYETLDAIRYWRDKNLPISVLTYHVYELDGRHLIEFHSFSTEPWDQAAPDTGYYIVNTNISFRDDGYKDMLSKNKASAYHDRKNWIDGIGKGSAVFLYHTGVGICAMGKAIQKVQEARCDGVDGAEHFVQLAMKYKADPVKQPEKCVPAWEINSAASRSYRFRQTCFSIGKDIAEKIEELLKTRHAGK